MEARLAPRASAIPRHRVLSGAVHLLGDLKLVPAQHRWAAAAAAPGPGRAQSRGRAFADEVAFELGQGREDVEHELAAGGGGVDCRLFVMKRGAVP
jgi:hypothetical protein